METATIAPAGIDPALREEVKQTLEGGESLAALFETVRQDITRRPFDSDFIRHGMAAIGRTAAAGDGIAAETVMARLEARLADARKAGQK